MIVKHFGCTTIYNKALYKCIIHSFIKTWASCQSSWCEEWFYSHFTLHIWSIFRMFPHSQLTASCICAGKEVSNPLIVDFKVAGSTKHQKQEQSSESCSWNMTVSQKGQQRSTILGYNGGKKRYPPHKLQHWSLDEIL